MKQGETLLYHCLALFYSNFFAAVPATVLSLLFPTYRIECAEQHHAAPHIFFFYWHAFVYVHFRQQLSTFNTTGGTHR